MENVGFPIRIDLYLSSLGFLQQQKTYILKIKLETEIMLTNEIEIICSLEIAYSMINVEREFKKQDALQSAV